MHEENRSDEVNLLELANLAKRYKLLVLVLPVVAAVLAVLLVSFVLHPAWEASAILETGKALGRGAEPTLNVIERIKHPSFASKALGYANIKPDEQDMAQA